MSRLTRLASMPAALGALCCSLHAGCSNDASTSSPAFPAVADYDRSCQVDSECALVRGEGCASCGRAAVAATAAAAYEAAYAEAQKSERCQKTLATVGPCGSMLAVEPRCAASLCAVSVRASDGGSDASDAASD